MIRSRFLVLVHNPLFGKCPCCSQDYRLHRSKVRTLRGKVLASLTFRRLYRCSSCGWRGHLFTLIFSVKNLAELVLLMSVAAGACLLLTQILRRI